MCFFSLAQNKEERQNNQPSMFLITKNDKKENQRLNILIAHSSYFDF